MIHKLLSTLLEKKKPSGYGWLRKSEVIKELKDCELSSLEHTNEPKEAMVVHNTWNAAVQDCIETIQKL